MKVVVPPEFELFARRQVLAGVVASEEEAVAFALRSYLDDLERIQKLVDPAITALERGEGVDGEAYMQKLLTTARARVAAAG